MPVQGVGSEYAPPAKTTAPRASGGLFDQETFLKLLVAQFKNPSPFSPPDTDKVMEQAVQFGMLERLVKVEEALREMSRAAYLAQAAEIVGREVVVLADNRRISGTVERVLLNEFGARVVLGAESYDIGQVVEVG
ncbi:MAG: flagellar hook capping FlgD N-terminal domain-containing protein [Bacillota bacterium]